MAGFGTFTLGTTEQPQYGSYSGWVRKPKYFRQTPLGAAIDVVQLLGAASRSLTFELVLTLTRFQTLEALVGTTATWTDPVDDTARSAMLLTAVPVAWYIPGATTGARKLRVAVELVEQ